MDSVVCAASQGRPSFVKWIVDRLIGTTDNNPDITVDGPGLIQKHGIFSLCIEALELKQFKIDVGISGGGPDSWYKWV